MSDDVLMFISVGIICLVSLSQFGSQSGKWLIFPKLQLGVLLIFSVVLLSALLFTVSFLQQLRV